MIFTQTDSGSPCSAAQDLGCSGRSASSVAVADKVASVGGTAGSTPYAWQFGASNTNVVVNAVDCTVPASTSWDAGTWTVRFNVVTSNMNLTITEIHICRVNSSCANQATIGSATGLSIALSSTGVKSQNVTGVAQTPGVGDRVLIVFVGSNGAMSSQSADIIPDQNIDSPFTEGNKTVTPTTAALTTTTFAPTVTASDHKTVTPTTASLSLSAFAPSVTVGVRATPDTASLTTATFAPTVSVTDNQTVTPTTAALTLATFAPSVTASDHKTVTPGTAALSLTAFAPTVTASDHKTVTPDTASLSLATFAPTVSVSSAIVVTPETAALVLTTFAPTVTATESASVEAAATTDADAFTNYIDDRPKKKEEQPVQGQEAVTEAPTAKVRRPSKDEIAARKAVMDAGRAAELARAAAAEAIRNAEAAAQLAVAMKFQQMQFDEDAATLLLLADA